MQFSSRRFIISLSSSLTAFDGQCGGTLSLSMCFGLWFEPHFEGDGVCAFLSPAEPTSLHQVVLRCLPPATQRPPAWKSQSLCRSSATATLNGVCALAVSCITRERGSHPGIKALMLSFHTALLTSSPGSAWEVPGCL